MKPHWPAVAGMMCCAVALSSVADEASTRPVALAEVLAAGQVAGPALNTLSLPAALLALGVDESARRSIPRHCLPAAEPKASADQLATPTPPKKSALAAAYAAAVDADDRETIGNERVAIYYGRFKRLQASPAGAVAEQLAAEAAYRQRLAERNGIRIEQRRTRMQLANLTGRDLVDLGVLESTDLDALIEEDALPEPKGRDRDRLATTLPALDAIGKIRQCHRTAEHIERLMRHALDQQIDSALTDWTLLKHSLIPVADSQLRLAEHLLAAEREAHDAGRRPAMLGERSTELAEAQRYRRVLRAALFVAALRYQEWSAGAAVGLGN